MNKRKKILTAVLVIGIVVQATVSYAEKIDAVQSSKTNRVDIVIDSGVAVAGKPVMVKIEKKVQNPESGLEEIEVNYMTSGYTDKDGKFNFSYVNGKHTGFLTITADVAGKKITDDYLKMGEAEYKEIIDALDGGLNATPPSDTEIKEKLQYYDEGIALDKTRLNSLSDIDAVYSIMVNDETFKGKVNDFGDVKNSFYSSVMMQCINEDKDCFVDVMCEEPYKTVVNNYSGLVPEVLSSASASVLEAVKNGMKDRYGSISELTNDTELLLLQKSVVLAEHWNDVKSIMEKYANAGKLDINTDKSSNVFKSFMGKEYDSYEEYEKVFDDFNEPIVRPSTGGGGGGGGIVSAPVFVLPDIPQTPNQEPLEGIPVFSDMEDAKWATYAVNFTTENGITSGVGNGKFEPNRTVTRAEATKMVLAMIDVDLIESQQKFDDVPIDSWAYKYINTAAEFGIVSGRSETEFDPNAFVTRQEMAVMAYHAMLYIDAELKATSAMNFVDNDEIAPWAEGAIVYMYEKGIMVGFKSNDGFMFRPTMGITRAECATVIYNILK